MQLLKCNTSIFGKQINLQLEDEIISEHQRLSFERKKDFIYVTDAWTNLRYRRKSLKR